MIFFRLGIAGEVADWGTCSRQCPRLQADQKACKIDNGEVICCCVNVQMSMTSENKNENT